MAGDGSTTGSGSGSDTGADETGVPPGQPPPPRPTEQSCRFDGWAPGLLPPVEFEPVLTLERADVTAMTADAAGLWLGTADGTIVHVATEVPDPSPTVAASLGAAVVGLAARDGALFVRLAHSDGTPAIAVNRYPVSEAGLDTDARLRVLRVVHAAEARAGEGLAFDADGHLLVPLGDLAQGDAEGPARDRTERAGSLLRLDVSELTVDYGYAIAADNPWADEGGAAAEAWAVGLRDPAGCALDPSTLEPWCADRGVLEDEASTVTTAADLGWPVADGRSCRLPSGDCSALGLTFPRVAYPRDTGTCGAVAGGVARGGDPLLDGAYVFGDRCSGRLWAARIGLGGAADVRAIVAELSTPPRAFATAGDGRLWMVDAAGNLGPLSAEPNPQPFPTQLADSGCFEDPAALLGAPDVLPFTINSPLWSDGAQKRRAIVLPVGATAGVDEDGGLVFPEGTALLKTFAVAPDDAEPDDVRPIETRVMIRRRFGWEFHSYRWADDGLDATLLDQREPIEIPVVRGGEATTLPYTFPSREGCTFCHGAAPSAPLGTRLDQLARAMDYGTGPVDQLEALESIGVFDEPLPAAAAMADPADPDASLHDRSRAYLHANCGHCHRPGGWTPPDLTMDLRWATPLSDTALCDPVQYGFPIFDADYRVVPGDPEASLVWQRLSHRGDGQMPPTGTAWVDPTAEVIAEWITQLDGCEP